MTTGYFYATIKVEFPMWRGVSSIVFYSDVQFVSPLESSREEYP
jgi:hypothetical protein